MTHCKTGKITFRIGFYLELRKQKFVDFGQFAVESFIGDQLNSSAICDDVVEYHENSSSENLILGGTANNDNKNHEGDHENGSIIGVYRRKNTIEVKYDASWVVVFRILTPDGPTGFVEATKRFSIKEHGYEKARKLAMAYQKKYTLKDGMNYECVRVAPTVRKTSV